MAKNKEKVQFRFYEISGKDLVLVLAGNKWIQEYGVDIDFLHFHNYLEIGICHYGEGYLVLDEKESRFHSKMLEIVPPNHLHTTMCDPGIYACWDWIYLDVERIVASFFTPNPVVAKAIIEKLYKRCYLLEQEEHPVLTSLLQTIAKEMTEKKQYYRESVHGLLQSLMVEIMRLDDHSISKELGGDQLYHIGNALRYVDEHYAEEIRISQLADACGISESHFRKLFVDMMNMKPGDYVNMIRIQNACDLIRKSPIAMEEICYRVGFINQSTFNRNFKKIVGISPYQWKKNEKNKDENMQNFNVTAIRGW